MTWISIKLWENSQAFERVELPQHERNGPLEHHQLFPNSERNKELMGGYKKGGRLFTRHCKASAGICAVQRTHE